jgi:hypothetical protein
MATVREDESIAMEGLNVAGYFGKWNEAKRLAHGHDLSENHMMLPYWERVRLLFLELGGEHIK